MARKAQIEREKKLKKLAEIYEAQRQALRAAHDSAGLSRLPNNSNPNRQRRRCALTGRSRSIIRRFGVSRITFRELALNGLLPGVTKASW